MDAAPTKLETKKTGNRANLTNAGKGRPKGVPNKIAMEAKQAIALAAEGLGGVPRLIDWAKEDPKNESTFWASIYTKLVPLTVANAPGETLKFEQVANEASTFSSRMLSLVATGSAASGTGETVQ